MWSEIHHTQTQQDSIVLSLLETGVETMKMLELFSGTKTVSNSFNKLGWETFTVDINEKLKPDLCCNILTLDTPRILQDFGKPEVIWASPDCTKFSWASGKRNEFRASNDEPLTPLAQEAIELVKHTLLLIEELEPTYWFLENPDHGALKNFKWMKQYGNELVAYCNYGKPYRKLTRIWGRFPPSWHPRSRCNHFRHDVQNIKGFKDAKARSEVPEDLALDIAQACIEDGGKQIPTLEDWL